MFLKACSNMGSAGVSLLRGPYLTEAVVAYPVAGSLQISHPPGLVHRLNGGVVAARDGR